MMVQQQWIWCNLVVENYRRSDVHQARNYMSSVASESWEYTQSILHYGYVQQFVYRSYINKVFKENVRENP